MSDQNDQKKRMKFDRINELYLAKAAAAREYEVAYDAVDEGGRITLIEFLRVAKMLRAAERAYEDAYREAN